MHTSLKRSLSIAVAALSMSFIAGATPASALGFIGAATQSAFTRSTLDAGSSDLRLSDGEARIELAGRKERRERRRCRRECNNQPH